MSTIDEGEAAGDPATTDSDAEPVFVGSCFIPQRTQGNYASSSRVLTAFLNQVSLSSSIFR